MDDMVIVWTGDQGRELRDVQAMVNSERRLRELFASKR